MTFSVAYKLCVIPLTGPKAMAMKASSRNKLVNRSFFTCSLSVVAVSGLPFHRNNAIITVSYSSSATIGLISLVNT